MSADDTLHIASARLSADIATTGAELRNLSDADGRLLQWTGDPAVWNGRAPILFPIIGLLQHGRYRLGDRTYAMPKHGFARHARFDVVSHAPDAAVLRLSSNEETRAAYPFEFTLDVAFALSDATLDVRATIANHGNAAIANLGDAAIADHGNAAIANLGDAAIADLGDAGIADLGDAGIANLGDAGIADLGDAAMPASFGFHPAFAWPLPYGQRREDHDLRFAHDELAPIRRIDGDGFLRAEPQPTPVVGDRLALRDALFDADAVIFDRLASRAVTYGASAGPRIEVRFDDFAALGVWTKPGGAHFVCIEPWQGFSDPVGFEGDIRNKPGIVAIAPRTSRAFAMTVRLIDAPG